jgi:hypothetical protein
MGVLLFCMEESLLLKSTSSIIAHRVTYIFIKLIKSQDQVTKFSYTMHYTGVKI